MGRTKTQMTEIPMQLIFDEILTRLPAKSLLRFKCVCRQWNSLISSTRFAKTHVQHPFSLSSRFVLTHDNGVGGWFEAVDYGGLNLDLKNFGGNFADSCNWLSASCNGLAFLISTLGECKETVDYLNIEPDYLRCYDIHYLVYNPVLGLDAFVKIDHPDKFVLGGKDFPANKYNFGFGYDPSIDDYNIVAISLPLSPSCPDIVVYVYSLRSQQWKAPRKFKQDRLPLKFQNQWYNQIGTLVKETLHWGITLGKDKKYIAAFHLATQESQDDFKYMQLPYDNFGIAGTCLSHSAFSLCCMDDCLCAWGRYGDGDVVEMWMMKEYGVQESWTKLFRFDPGYFCRNFFGLTKSGMVLIIPTTNKLMLADLSCDPPKCKDIEFEEQWEVVNYVQSLVSPRAISEGR